MSAVAILALLWQVSWHAAAVAAVVGVARLTVGRAVPGRWRHALWAVVLCRLVMPVAPHSRASVFNLWRPAPPPAAVVATAVHTRAPTAVDPAESVDPVPPVAVPVMSTAAPRWPVVLTIAWLVVAVALVARLVVANVRFGRLLGRSSRPPDARMAAAFEAGRRDMRAGRRATLVVTDVVATPAVWGVVRPRVLLPTPLATSLSDERARLVFLHELAHVRCHDVLIDWAWAVVRAAYWFNPVVWAVGPVRRHDREVARDEMVLSIVGPAGAEAYGRTLLDLARPGGRPAMAVGLVGLFDGRGLSRRVKHVARLKAGRGGSAIFGAAVLGVAGCASLTNPAVPPAAAAGPSVAVTRPAEVDPDAPSPATAATLAQLDRKMPEVRFNARPLSDVIEFVRDLSGINVYVDWRSLEAIGVPRTSPVTARLRQVKYAKALELMLKSVDGDDYDHQLAYVVDDDVVTISTRRELDKAVVTRKYDVNDLLFVPTNDDPAGPSSAASRERRIGEIVQYVEQNVDPNSWADRTYHGEHTGYGRVQTSPLRGVLLVTATPGNHRKARAVLDSLRASQAVQVTVSARVVTVDDPDRLPADVRAVLDRATGTGPRGGAPLSADEADAVGRAPGTTLLTVPTVTVFSGERAVVSATDARSFTESYRAVVRPDGGGTVFEPVVTSVPIGLTFDVGATASPDRRSAFLHLHPTLSRLAGVATEPWPGAPAGVSVQRPVVLTSAAQTSCSIPSGQTMLLGCGGFATDGAADRGRRAQVFLLVKPVVLDERAASGATGRLLTITNARPAGG